MTLFRQMIAFLFLAASAFAAPDQDTLVARVRTELAAVLQTKDPMTLPVDKPVSSLGADGLDVMDWVMRLEMAFEIHIGNVTFVDSTTKRFRSDISILDVADAVARAIAAKKKNPGLRLKGDRFLSITLERTVCVGACPAYRVTVFADGRVDYEGKAFVKTIGKASKRIAPGSLTALQAKVVVVSFWDMEDHYRTKKNSAGQDVTASGRPTYRVTVTTAKETKTVEDYFGAPVGLRELEDMVDQVAGTAAWIGPVEEPRKIR